ncbi:hypothetical protein CERSUDRAFT_58814 [Gelatoporia subvermispora B]|uniref:RlpA-like protein double-psi beta-barrel domain-containing protein n=1 Tax=Ceriporiopsis subvermispora (strain B) TaxID=914234 RepID=M2Q608_CERS8|nr:hypothetical protein CERSUDRAFT_58814 [Gelatoporia subvermispora B]
MSLTNPPVTFYDTSVGIGACGIQNSNSQHIAALSSSQYDSGAHCGAEIQIEWEGNTVTATVEDLCAGCGSGSVDLTPSAFEVLAPTSVGRLHGATWNFI